MGLKVLKYPVGQEPQVVELDGSLESMQKVVGGYIQAVPLGEGFNLVCNEEGKLIGLPPNRHLGFDVIAGDFFITKDDGEGDFTSLTDSDVALVKYRIK